MIIPDMATNDPKTKGKRKSLGNELVALGQHMKYLEDILKLQMVYTETIYKI